MMSKINQTKNTKRINRHHHYHRYRMQNIRYNKLIARFLDGFIQVLYLII